MTSVLLYILSLWPIISTPVLLYKSNRGLLVENNLHKSSVDSDPICQLRPNLPANELPCTKFRYILWNCLLFLLAWRYFLVTFTNAPLPHVGHYEEVGRWPTCRVLSLCEFPTSIPSPSKTPRQKALHMDPLWQLSIKCLGVTRQKSKLWEDSATHGALIEPTVPNKAWLAPCLHCLGTENVDLEEY